MSNIIAIIRKELRSYFTQPLAYILLVVFLGLSSFFYFRAVLVSQQLTLRPLFGFLPWILLFFIPALTMGLLAKEKESGTLEILTTQKVSYKEIVLGKFLAVLSFIFIAILITLIIPFSLALTTKGGGGWDWGIIFSQYLGSFFLAATFIGVGLFASSLTKNQIAAFILGVTFIFVLIFLGSNTVLLALPHPFNLFVQKLSILDHYQGIARGVLDLRDLIYFLSLIFLFLYLTTFFFFKELRNKKEKRCKWSWKAVIAFVILALCINLVSDKVKARFDLTQERVFTLSSATKKIISQVENEVELSLFVSKKLPVQISYQAQQIKDTLSDYQKFSNGKVKFNIYYPDADEAAKSKAQEFNIPPVQFNVVSQDEFQIKQGYLGIGISLKEKDSEGEENGNKAVKKESIPFVERLDNLEYQLTSLIWKLTQKEKKKIVFLTGHNEQSLYSDFSLLRNELSKQYDASEYNLENSEKEGEEKVYQDLPKETKVVVLAGPTQKLASQEIETIKSFLSQGGSALVLARQIEVNPRLMFATTTQSNLNEIINDWGVKVENNLVYDLRSQESISFKSGFVNYILPYPFWLRTLAKEKGNILKDIKTITLPWASEIVVQADKKEDITFQPLFTTSRAAGVQWAPNINLNPQQSFAADDLKERVVAVAAEKENGQKKSRLVVVGESDFATDEFVKNFPENLAFALNALEWLAQDEILSSIRTKNLQFRPLIFRNENQKDIVKYGNMIGVPFLVILAGIYVMYKRRKMTQRRFS